MLSSKKIIKADEKIHIDQFKLESFGAESKELPKIFTAQNGEIPSFVLENFDENERTKAQHVDSDIRQSEEISESGQKEEKDEGDFASETSEGKAPNPNDSANDLQPLEIANIEKIVEEKISQALKEAEELKNKAIAEGKNRGYEEGLQEGLKAAREQVERLKSIISSLESLPHKLLKDYKTWIVDAALTIASHIVRTELTTNKQTFLNMLEHLVKQLDEDTPITIYLNPEDMVTLRLTADLEEWAQMQGRSIKFKEDPTISLGSCRLETNVELLDATLERCIEELKREALSSIV